MMAICFSAVLRSKDSLKNDLYVFTGFYKTVNFKIIQAFCLYRIIALFNVTCYTVCYIYIQF